MKKKKFQLERIESIINNDRLSCGENFCNLLKADIEKVFLDYFESPSPVSLQFFKTGRNYRVEVVLNATGVKQFMSLVQEN